VREKVIRGEKRALWVVFIIDKGFQSIGADREKW